MVSYKEVRQRGVDGPYVIGDGGGGCFPVCLARPHISTAGHSARQAAMSFLPLEGFKRGANGRHVNCPGQGSSFFVASLLLSAIY
jgi:hypothetical protein